MRSSGGKHLERYINESCPRISIEEDNEVDHFGLMAFLKSRNQAFRETIDTLASLEKEQEILLMLKKSFFPFFSEERSELLTYVLRSRFKKIREI